MRKRYRILLLAAIVAGCVARLGFALTPEGNRSSRDISASSAPELQARVVSVAATAATASIVAARPAVLRTSSAAPIAPSMPISDGTMLFFVGTAFFGLAAVMRRAI